MSRFKISSCRNWEFRNKETAVSFSHALFVFLSLCACTDIVHLDDDIVALIHYGVETNPAKWPWHATLLMEPGLCGGTFIDNNTIITAAHCVVSGDKVRRENDINVFGGRKYSDAINNDTQQLNLAKIIIHPQYNYSSLANDIAILKLTSEIKITNFVKPVTIWDTDIDENKIFGSQGTLIGFGLDEDDEQSDTLQEATIPVLDKQTCLAYDSETYGSYLTSQMYCAGGKDNVSPCNGDSGGGMFFNFNDTWYLRGLLSFSPTRPNEKRNLCDSSKPTVFTDVTKHPKWILRYTNTTKWLKELKPCKNGAIEIDTECNAANRFGFLSQELRLDERVSFMRFNLEGDQAFNGHEVLAVNGIVGVDKDCVDGRFYWTEIRSDLIFSTKYDEMVKKALFTEEVSAGDVAVDWISRRLYWVNRDEHTVEVTTLDNPGLRTTVMTNVDSLNIAVDPLQGKLYITIENRGIGQSNLDGSEPELLLEKSKIYGMTVLIATGELCYVDSNTFKIDCIDTRSRRIRTIVSNVTDTFELVVTDDIIYWLNEDRKTIESVNLQGVRQKPLLNPNFKIRSKLIVLTDFCPIFYSPCAKNNGGCPNNTICFLNPRVQSGKICKFFSKFSDQTVPSTIITSKPLKPISHSKGKQRKWPWHAVIYSTLIKNTGYLCGGTIINMNTILTAAHCFYYNTPEGYRVLPEIGLSVSVGNDYVDGITDDTQVLNRYGHTRRTFAGEPFAHYYKRMPKKGSPNLLAFTRNEPLM